jgi:PleD family two-component response regulator
LAKYCTIILGGDIVFSKIKISSEQTITPVPISMKSIASSGLKAMDPPSILVVEDTAMCAKLLCMILDKTGWKEEENVTKNLACQSDSLKTMTDPCLVKKA